MRFGSFRYLVKQGLKNMSANRLMTFASIGVLTACFILTGIATLLLLNVNSIVNYLSGQNEIVVNLLQDVTDEQATAIGQQISDIPNVSTVEYASKADAFNEVQRMLESYSNLLDGYENIFPARFHVTVDDLSFIEQTNTQISAIAGVEETYVPVDLAGVMITINNGITYGGFAIVLILASVSIILIVNTIKLTVFARRREISIMKYVGATNLFIRLPFFVEGVAVGIIAGIVSSLALCGAYYLVYEFLHGMHNMWILSILSSLLKLENIWYWITLAALSLGTLLGGIGTALSVRNHLKV